MFNPKPVQQPQPSLLIGGDGAAAKRRAALVGDGWLPMNHALDAAARRRWREINEKRAAAGRDGHHHAHDRRRHRLARPTSTATATPASTACSCTRSRSSKEALDGIRRFGDEILAKLDA